jgi:hypothetical protein
MVEGPRGSRRWTLPALVIGEEDALMGAASLIPLPLDAADDSRLVDRLTARAIHLALLPVEGGVAADALVAAANADLRVALFAAARIDRALAVEHSVVVERAAAHLHAAIERLRGASVPSALPTVRRPGP